MGASSSRSNKKMSILIVGATGQLGSKITEAALAHPKLQVNILVRDLTKNQELVSKVKAAGGRVIKGDLADPSSLQNVTKGMHTVISAVSGNDEKITVDGQIALAKDSVKNGVKRFVPSDFGVDYTDVTREELLASWVTAYKVKLEDYLKTTKLPLLRFYAGGIAETMFYVFSQGHSYWGEDIKHNITSYDNIGRLVAAAVAKPRLTGRITYSGGNYTAKEMVDIYNKVRGTNIEIKQAGSIADLKNVVEAKKSEGDHGTAGFLALLTVIYDKRSKFPMTDNSRFPEVRAESLEEFLTKNSGVKL